MAPITGELVSCPQLSRVPRSAPKLPIRHLQPADASASQDLATKKLLRGMNRRHLEANASESPFAARIASYELAARMQLSVPDLADLSSEPQYILDQYGAADESNPTRAAFAQELYSRSPNARTRSPVCTVV